MPIADVLAGRRVAVGPNADHLAARARADSAVLRPSIRRPAREPALIASRASTSTSPTRRCFLSASASRTGASRTRTCASRRRARHPATIIEISVDVTNEGRARPRKPCFFSFATASRAWRAPCSSSRASRRSRFEPGATVTARLQLPATDLRFLGHRPRARARGGRDRDSGRPVRGPVHSSWRRG